MPISRYIGGVLLPPPIEKLLGVDKTVDTFVPLTCLQSPVKLVNTWTRTFEDS